MRTWEERGPYGRWLVAARLARGYKTAAAARKALAAAGLVFGSAYAEYESGRKKPSRNHMPLLEGFWGPFSDPLGPTETPDLATALMALAEEVRAAREERATLAAQVERMQAILDVLAPPAMRDAEVPDARDETMGSGR